MTLALDFDPTPETQAPETQALATQPAADRRLRPVHVGGRQRERP